MRLAFHEYEDFFSRGVDALREHRLTEAREMFAEAVARGRMLENQSPLAQALKFLGKVERNLHHPEVAASCYAEAAELYRATGTQLKFAHNIRHAADIERESGCLQLADPHYQQALSVYRHQGTFPWIWNAIRGYALLKRDQSGFEDQRFCGKKLAIFMQLRT
jgi:hypothetical protein